ncbi:MAG: MBL fold metallo-hydrolase [Tenericutes bacterium]|nr:MBL fold metallo-hydrolase [Mycoplasmatota bacterium]
MKIIVLSSSSSGNSTYIELNNIKFLIDAGLPYGVMKEKLYEINVSPEEIDFIIVTHAHIDHVRSIHTFNRVYKTKIYISSETLNEYNKKDYLKDYILFDNLDNIENLKFVKIPISHDKKGFGFVFEHKNNSLVYMADTGMIHLKHHKLLMNKTVYLMESNHNVEMEMNGTKDYTTKLRNIGPTGHLSNEDCAKYLDIFVGDKTKYICLIHISEKDNTYEEAYKVNRKIINKKINIIVAYKDKISEAINI